MNFPARFRSTTLSRWFGCSARAHLTPPGCHRLAPAVAIALGLTMALRDEATAQSRLPIVATGAFQNPPYQYLDAGGKPSGFDVEMLRAVTFAGFGETAQVIADLSSIEGVPGEDFIPVYLGRPNMGGDRSDLEFCVPHRMLEFGIFKRNDSLVRSLHDLRRKEIVVERSSAVITFLVNHGFEERLVEVDGAPEALALIATGEYEVAVLERNAVLGSYAGNLEGIVLLDAPVYLVPYGFALPKGHPEVRNALEQGMRIVQRAGHYDRIAKKYFGSADAGATAQASIFTDIYGYVMWVAVPLALFLGGVTLNSLGIRRKAMNTVRHLQDQLVDAKTQNAEIRDSIARQRFVLNRVGTASLIDEIAQVSGSKEERQPGALF